MPMSPVSITWIRVALPAVRMGVASTTDWSPYKLPCVIEPPMVVESASLASSGSSAGVVRWRREIAANPGRSLNRANKATLLRRPPRLWMGPRRQRRTSNARAFMILAFSHEEHGTYGKNGNGRVLHTQNSGISPLGGCPGPRRSVACKEIRDETE